MVTKYNKISLYYGKDSAFELARAFKQIKEQRKNEERNI